MILIEPSSKYEDNINYWENECSKLLQFSTFYYTNSEKLPLNFHFYLSVGFALIDMLVSPSSGFLSTNIDQKSLQCTKSWILFSLEQQFSCVHVTSTAVPTLTPLNATQSKMARLLLWTPEPALGQHAGLSVSVYFIRRKK